MGMFDSFIGQIKCPNCKNQQKTEVQFKWSECLLLDYELGDVVPGAQEGLYVEDDWFNERCSNCKTEFMPNVVLKNGKVIAFISKEELQRTDIEHIQDIPYKYMKNLRYDTEKALAKGFTKETADFKKQPFKENQSITAFEREWKVAKGWRKDFNSEKVSEFFKLSGCATRKSDYWFVYIVVDATGLKRFVEVSDRIKHWSDNDDRYGNMLFSETYGFKDEHFLFSEIF
ncbi:hypothetical protein MOB37_18485 [Bacillus spizizenii]|uniref:hypothetical protein n=1 Tax=Bacillus inaquosorum TaxID=483913 RepID=UPI00227F03B1|nr:hypothetical protein [Bacillus inaquosorum]MCY7829867.1 hypothetical protein [Bacillus spizizenii]MCY8706775.1 hypothetical protein [Bacillus inaquosorum]